MMNGLKFDLATLLAEPARVEDEYSGVRLKFVAELAGARLPIFVDIGYGDASRRTSQIDYPSLLGFAAPRLKAYPPETVVAEKFQALVALGCLTRE